MSNASKFTRWLQQRFNSAGADLKVTGRNDAATQAIIREFQRAMGFKKITGTATAETVQALQAYKPASLKASGSIGGGGSMAVSGAVNPPALHGSASLSGGSGMAALAKPIHMLPPQQAAPQAAAPAAPPQMAPGMFDQRFGGSPPPPQPPPGGQTVGLPWGQQYPDVGTMLGAWGGQLAAPAQGLNTAVGGLLGGLNDTANMQAQPAGGAPMQLGPSGAGADASGQNFTAPDQAQGAPMPDPNMPDWLRQQKAAQLAHAQQMDSAPAPDVAAAIARVQADMQARMDAIRARVLQQMRSQNVAGY